MGTDQEPSIHSTKQVHFILVAGAPDTVEVPHSSHLQQQQQPDEKPHLQSQQQPQPAQQPLQAQGDQPDTWQRMPASTLKCLLTHRPYQVSARPIP